MFCANHKLQTKSQCYTLYTMCYISYNIFLLYMRWWWDSIYCHCTAQVGLQYSEKNLTQVSPDCKQYSTYYFTASFEFNISGSRHNNTLHCMYVTNKSNNHMYAYAGMQWISIHWYLSLHIKNNDDWQSSKPKYCLFVWICSSLDCRINYNMAKFNIQIAFWVQVEM